MSSSALGLAVSALVMVVLMPALLQARKLCNKMATGGSGRLKFPALFFRLTAENWKLLLNA